MARRITSKLTAAVLALALSGCTVDELGTFIAVLGEPTAGSTTGAPGTTVPAGGRAESDRPDEQPGNQIHAFYVVPSDAADRKLDTDGTIAGWIQEGASWLKSQSGGHILRCDTQGGQPDVTFFRSKYTEAELFDKRADILDAIDDEVRQAGHNDPTKINVYFYDGRCGKEKATAGLGRLMSAAIFLPQAPDPQNTALHEIFHALGAVPECAPNRASDAHVLDHPLDLMAPARERGVPILDFEKNDYFGHGRSGCLDVAKSAFLEPLPPGAVPMAGVPASTQLDASAFLHQPAWRTGGAAGEPGIEAAAMAFLTTLRQDAGLAPLPTDDRLREAARREAAANLDLEAGEGLRLAGYAGSGGATTVTMTLGVDDDPVSRVEAYMAKYRSNFATSFGKAGLTDMAVGASLKGKQLKLALYSGTRPFDIEEVRLGAGPLGTRTLVGRARMRAGQGFDRVRVLVNGEYNAHTYWLKAGESITFHTSVPTSGRHEVALLASKPGQTTFSRAATYMIDGAQPLETAFVGE